MNFDIETWKHLFGIGIWTLVIRFRITDSEWKRKMCKSRDIEAEKNRDTGEKSYAKRF